MLLFDCFIKNEAPLVEIKVTYDNVIEKRFNVNIEIKNWLEIETQVNKLLNKIKQEKLESIIDFADYQQDWQQAKLLLKLAQHIKSKITIGQIRKYYLLLKGQKVQFDLEYSKDMLISNFKLSSYLPEMFNELWYPSFNEQNEFVGLEQVINFAVEKEKIEAAIIWIIKAKLNKTVFNIKLEDEEERLKNNLPLEKAQQFFISDLFFEIGINIEIAVQEKLQQFNVKIAKAKWEDICKTFAEKLAAFKDNSTVTNQKYKDIISKYVTIDKIKAYYDYIIGDYHQFIIDFNEDLINQEKNKQIN